jgi:hypothetical protein
LCVRVKRGQRDRPLLTVTLSVLGGKLAGALLARQDSAAGQLDDHIVGRQGGCCLSIRG